MAAIGKMHVTRHMPARYAGAITPQKVRPPRRTVFDCRHDWWREQGFLMPDSMLWLTIACVSACTVVWTVVPCPVGRMPRADVNELRRRRNLSRVLSGPHPGLQAPPEATASCRATGTQPAQRPNGPPGGARCGCGCDCDCDSERYASAYRGVAESRAPEASSSAAGHGEA
ncbi:hypothetical protein GCM10010353_36670 [Streptomyces chryseus]|nr:hypothetical protein GCM10010353_36670 [Streptomyces chryseus]